MSKQSAANVTASGLLHWTDKLIKAQEQYITLTATGSKPPNVPSLTLVDQGEGQTPLRVPDTFMSIDKSNKLRIPFVQGKFNMGGTGALKFCGKEGLQLLITRRNPAILEKWKKNEKWGSSDSRANQWSVTIVRRERPTEAAGAVRNSVYRYLAPVGSDSNSGKGQVLSFTAQSLPLMSVDNKAYAREIEFGTAIKLYEYDVKGFGSHITQPDGLLSRIELLLPEIALPVRLHECRACTGVANAVQPKRCLWFPVCALVTKVSSGVARGWQFQRALARWAQTMLSIGY